jgi:hypothetical protein
MKKVVASVVSLLFLASSCFASEAVLKCKWVATGEVEGRLKLVEGKEFGFPVDLERGLFYYLENGMEREQKEILAKTGKEFLKQVEQLRREGKGEVFAPAGLTCRDEASKEGVVLLYFKEF